MTASAATAAAAVSPIARADEADTLLARVAETMDALSVLLRQETELVRAGRLRQAADCEKRKSELSGLYMADALRLRANHSRLLRIIPAARMGDMRRRHEAFQSILQTNLTVLATAHAVSEGILRAVSGELAKKSVPQTYGAFGRAVTPKCSAAAPLALSRML